jgi:hypothetical protein
MEDEAQTPKAASNVVNLAMALWRIRSTNLFPTRAGENKKQYLIVDNIISRGEERRRKTPTHTPSY